MSIRDLTMADADWFLPLNNAAVPHVNALSAADLKAMLAEADLAWAVMSDGDPAGGFIAFRPGTTYDSANYLWFAKHYDDFLYIDRVVVDPARRGSGIGQTIYRDVIGIARDRGVMLCCEVNERPPNPGSMRFHEKFGFVEAGRQETEGGKKSVVLLSLPA